jgi:hypothetical protein
MAHSLLDASSQHIPGVFVSAGLENISHMPPATGPDKQPTNVVRVSNALKHK